MGRLSLQAPEVARRDVTCTDRREEEGDAERIILGKGEEVHKVASEKLLFAIGEGIVWAFIAGDTGSG